MPTKTMRERERELQTLLSTPEGKAELQALADQYAAMGGVVHASNSLVTCVLIHERNSGAISG
jgi:hypothetical protein